MTMAVYMFSPLKEAMMELSINIRYAFYSKNRDTDRRFVFINDLEIPWHLH